MDQKDRWAQLKNEYNAQENLETAETLEEQEEEKTPMTEEEKQKVKKQMMFLIWGIIIVIFGYVIISVISNLNDKEEQVVETPEEPKEVLPDGEIEITNSIVQEIDKMFTFDIRNPLYEANILKLYSGNKVEVDNLDFQTKMLLITSNSTFNDYMLDETNLKNYKTKEVSLTKEKLEELSKEIFGRDINLNHENFKYYFINNNEVIYFNAELKDNKYIFTETTGKPSTIEVYKELKYVNKVAENLWLRYEVIFINEKGIYKDSAMKNLITNNKNDKKSALVKSDNYDYFYVQNEHLDYYLYGIESSFNEIK